MKRPFLLLLAFLLAVGGAFEAFAEDDFTILSFTPGGVIKGRTPDRKSVV